MKTTTAAFLSLSRFAYRSNSYLGRDLTKQRIENPIPTAIQAEAPPSVHDYPRTLYIREVFVGSSHQPVQPLDREVGSRYACSSRTSTLNRRGI